MLLSERLKNTMYLSPYFLKSIRTGAIYLSSKNVSVNTSVWNFSFPLAAGKLLLTGCLASRCIPSLVLLPFPLFVGF